MSRTGATLTLKLPAGVFLFVSPAIVVERVGSDGVGRYRLAHEVEIGFETSDEATTKRLADTLRLVVRDLDELGRGKVPEGYTTERVKT